MKETTTTYYIEDAHTEKDISKINHKLVTYQALKMCNKNINYYSNECVF